MVSERTEAPKADDGAARAAALEAKEKGLQAAMATIKAAFAILGARALVIFSAVCAAAAFGWALWNPDGWKVAGACLFTAMVFWPALYFDRG